MDVVAIIISVFALAVAGLAARYTYRQSVANEKLATIEQARRADELTATLDIDSGIDAEHENLPCLIISNRGVVAAERISFQWSALDNRIMPRPAGVPWPKRIEPGGHHNLTYHPVDPRYQSLRFQVILHWEDGRGPQTSTHAIVVPAPPGTSP